MFKMTIHFSQPVRSIFASPSQMMLGGMDPGLAGVKQASKLNVSTNYNEYNYAQTSNTFALMGAVDAVPVGPRMPICVEPSTMRASIGIVHRSHGSPFIGGRAVVV